MSDSIVRKIIEERIQDNWSETPIDWDNVSFDPTRGVSFISPIIEETDSNKRGFGCTNRIYTAIIEIRIPKNKGTALIAGYTDQIKALFNNYSSGNFYCIKSKTQRVGSSSKQWHQRNVILSCRYTDYS